MGGGASFPENPLGVITSKQEGDINGDVYRSASLKEDDLICKLGEATTLHENFEAALAAGPEKPYLGVREGDGYVWESYKQCGVRRTNFGAGLVQLGMKPQSFLGIYSINCPEWTIADLACSSQSITTVSLYDTLGPAACQYIVQQSGIETVVYQKKNFDALLEIAAACDSMKTLIQIQPLDDDQKAKAKEVGMELLSFAEVEKIGVDNAVDFNPPQPEDLFTLCYTSGTTGDPKGVMLSHKNIISCVGGMSSLAIRLFADHPELPVIEISYLPCAHIYERVNQTLMTYMGGQIGFFGGSILTLVEDIGILQPTYFPAVPRLLNKLYAKIMAGVTENGGIKAMLFNKAVDSKTKALKNGYNTDSLWDKLVFSKIQARLGGRVKMIATGSAPIARHVMDFVRIAFACPVVEGYGQTECGGVATATHPVDYTTGHVGAPLPSMEIRLQSCPDLDYLIEDKPNPRGEICLRGPSICQGYYKMEEKTAETIDEDGWLHTGDIGMWLTNGTLKIIDRKKNLFKLAQGEYVAPEKVENVYGGCKWVLQSFVHGDSLKASLIAVVIPNFEVLVPYAKENGFPEDPAELVKDEAIKKMIMEDMRAVGKSLGLHGFEQVRDIILDSEEFTLENGLMTPTFKLKRPQTLKKYKAQIDIQYEALQ